MMTHYFKILIMVIFRQNCNKLYGCVCFKCEENEHSHCLLVRL